MFIRLGTINGLQGFKPTIRCLDVWGADLNWKGWLAPCPYRARPECTFKQEASATFCTPTQRLKLHEVRRFRWFEYSAEVMATAANTRWL